MSIGNEHDADPGEVEDEEAVEQEGGQATEEEGAMEMFDEPEQEQGNADDDMVSLMAVAEEVGLGILLDANDIHDPSNNATARQDTARLWRDYVDPEIGVQDICSEQAVGNHVPTEHDFLELFRHLGESNDTRVLAWYIREMFPTMEQNSSIIGALVREHVNQQNSLLPRPSEELIARFCDIEKWTKERNKKQEPSKKKKKRKSPSSSDDETQNKRKGLKYNCEICDEPKVDKAGRSHHCRPTCDQVVVAIKTRLQDIRKNAVTSPRPSANTQCSSSNGNGKRGPYKCGKCGILKKYHLWGCPDEYGRAARNVEDELNIKNIDDKRVDQIIRQEVESNPNFTFGADGRRIRFDPDKDVTKTFENEEMVAGTTSPRPLREQARHHIGLLRLGQESQIQEQANSEGAPPEGEEEEEHHITRTREQEDDTAEDA